MFFPSLFESGLSTVSRTYGPLYFPRCKQTLSSKQFLKVFVCARLLSLQPAQQAFPCGLGAKNQERESKTTRKMAQVKERGGGGEERKKKSVFWVSQSDTRIQLPVGMLQLIYTEYLTLNSHWLDCVPCPMKNLKSKYTFLKGTYGLELLKSPLG